MDDDRGDRARGTPTRLRPAARAAATARADDERRGRRMEVPGSAERVVRVRLAAHVTVHGRQVDVPDGGPGAQTPVRHVVHIAAGLHRAERGLATGQAARGRLAARAGRVVRRDQVRVGRRVRRARLAAPGARAAQQPARTGAQLRAGHAQRPRTAGPVPQPFAHRPQQFVQSNHVHHYINKTS